MSDQHPTPIGIRHLSGQIGLREPRFDSDGQTLVWLERRGADTCLVCRQRGELADRDVATHRAVRARVFYGGGDFTLDRGTIYYVGDGDRLCAQSLDGGPGRDLTPAQGHPASPAVSRDGRWVVYVHTDGSTDRLAIVDSDGDLWPQSLVSGADFYMQPSWHPNGRQLAWVEWDSPNMAWDGCRLMLGTLRRVRGGAPILDDRQILAGGPDTAVFQPTFSPNGRFLAYASDEAGCSQLWLHDLQTDERRCLTPDDAGDVASPGWVQGLCVMGFSADSRSLHFSRVFEARRQVWSCDLDLNGGTIKPLEALSEYTDVSHLACSPRGAEIAIVGSSSVLPERIVTVRANKARVQKRASSESLLPESLALGESICWQTATQDLVHGLLYPAPGVTGAAPLLVMIHGGPTSQDRLGFDIETQYWASRGWSVLCVNYRGSTGYGRAYMTCLRGQWGVYDVEDAVSGARHLIDTGRADPDRLAIMGGSAGGFTVLRTMALHPGLFRAAICRYGVSNLFSLTRTTHKFEARYTDLLIGPLPDAADRYRERSPVFSADALRDPVAIFQGDEDEVVPKDQSDEIVASLAERGIPHQYHVYEGEGHGWRRPETKEAYISAVESFLEQHVLFA